ncbi:MAG: HlyC/CorC family transporter [Alphaproteobacteria bacterium]|nr:HlyC/CorC family transporter [Alphaproteobacteria bacterium]
MNDPDGGPSSAKPPGNDPGTRRGRWHDLWRRLRRPRSGEATLRETIEELIEHGEPGEETAVAAERALLSNILKLRDITVEDVSVPRADIVAVEAATPLFEVIEVMSRTHHSRLPVYRGHLDDVIGMVHVKDVLPYARASPPPALESLVRKLLFAAPSMRPLDLLLQMRLARIHIALVVDEYGGIDGLATIEDLVEEIVGEIEDEHDVAKAPRLTVRPDGTMIADGRTTLEAFESRVGPVLGAEEREEVDTLGGLVSGLVGRVPGRGEIIPHPSGMEFEVIDADPRRIRRLRIRNIPTSPAAAAD